MDKDRRDHGRECFNRLREWDTGQTTSERLASAILQAEGYSVDPSHPLGGPDGGRDGTLHKNGLKFIAAVYFPRGKQTTTTTRNKFVDDLNQALEHEPAGFVFFTNQELTLGERKDLKDVDPNCQVEIFHLERISQLLNTAKLFGTRLEFLQIDMTTAEQISYFNERDIAQFNRLQELNTSLENTASKIIGYITGGDSFPIVGFTTSFSGIGKPRSKDTISISVKVEGDFPMHEVSTKITHLSDSPTPEITRNDTWTPEATAHFAAQGKTAKRFTAGVVTTKYIKTLGEIPRPELPAQFSVETFSRSGVFFQITTVGMGENQTPKVEKSDIWRDAPDTGEKLYSYP